MNEPIDHSTSPFSLGRTNLTTTIQVGAILVVAVVFRLLYLGHFPGLNGDEAFHGVQLRLLLGGEPSQFFTPTGLPLSPFYFLPTAIFQGIFGPSIWVLRLTAALSGVCLVGLTYWLLKDTFPSAVVVTITLLVAVSPINIAYSRIGWAPSQIILSTLFVIYFSWKQNWPALSVSMAVALWIHPTAIFLTPISMAVIGFPRLAQTDGEKRKLIAKVGASLVGLATVVTLLVHFFLPGIWSHPFGPQKAWHRMSDLSQLPEVFLQFGRLFSGVTAYDYMVGPMDRRVAQLFDLVFWTAAIPLVVVGGKALWRRRNWKAIALVTSIPVATYGFYLAAGLKSLRPGYDRYALFLVFPTLLAATLLGRATASSPKREQKMVVVVLVASWLFLGGFYHFYFQALGNRGGWGEVNYQTGPVEPKVKALNHLKEIGRRQKATLVITEQWHLYWPLVYLTPEDTGLQYLNLSLTVRPLSREMMGALQKSLARGAVLVGYKGGKLKQVIYTMVPRSLLEERVIRDYGGKPVIYLWWRKRATGH